MIYEEIDSYRKQIEVELNGYLKERGLTPFASYHASPLEIDLTTKPSVAIYLANADQGTASCNGQEVSCDWFLVYRLNTSATVRDIEENIKQFSAVFDYLIGNSFGDSSIITSSGVFRMDQGEPVNGGVFMITSTIDASMDYGW